MFEFHNQKAVYLQLKEIIEQAILLDSLKPHDPVPSIRTLAKDYKLNPITVSKTIDILVGEEVLYKKVGIGMFVCEQAKQKILVAQLDNFKINDLISTIEKAIMFGISKAEIEEIVNKIYGGKNVR